MDKTRLNKSFADCIDEVVFHLMNLPNAAVSIRLAGNISAPEGIPDDRKDLVSDNCRDLKIRDFYFED